MARNQNKTSPARLDSAQRMAKAIELRRHGETYADIALKAGYASPQAAHDAVKRALEQTLREPADGLRQLEAERLDNLHAAWFPKALEGQPDAAAVVLRVMERRARLLGLDAPSRSQVATQIEVGVEHVSAREALMARLDAISRRTETSAGESTI